MNNPEPETRWGMFVLTIAVTIGILMLASTAFAAPTVRDCQAHADRVVGPVAVGRDEGVPPEDMFRLLLTLGYNPEAAQIIVSNIYIRLKDKTPEEVKEDFMHHCAGAPT